MNDKGVMIIKLSRQENGRTAITVSGRRRGAPVDDKKLAKLLKDYQENCAPKWGYSSTQIIWC